MPNKFTFADEAGCFTFNREPNVSRYFILCTVTMDECSVGADLLSLRRQLAWEGEKLGDYFHATTDKQSVRDRVFETILLRPFSVHATIMEKSKAHAQARLTRATFYKLGYLSHFKYGVSRSVSDDAELLVTTASLGSKKERLAFQEAVSSVMRQMHIANWKTDFMPSQADPCLQVADYCAWAIAQMGAE